MYGCGVIDEADGCGCLCEASAESANTVNHQLCQYCKPQTLPVLLITLSHREASTITRSCDCCSTCSATDASCTALSSPPHVTLYQSPSHQTSVTCRHIIITNSSSALSYSIRHVQVLLQHSLERPLFLSFSLARHTPPKSHTSRQHVLCSSTPHPLSFIACPLPLRASP